MQPPMLATEKVPPKRGLIAMLVVTVTGFVLLVWVLAVQVWRAAAEDPQLAEKQAKLGAIRRLVRGFNTGRSGM